MPAAAAMLRVLHFFLPFGGCTTRVITCRTWVEGSQGFRPRPGRSRRPSSPCCSNRRDQVDTVLMLTPRAEIGRASCRERAESLDLAWAATENNAVGNGLEHKTER